MLAVNITRPDVMPLSRNDAGSSHRKPQQRATRQGQNMQVYYFWVGKCRTARMRKVDNRCTDLKRAIQIGQDTAPTHPSVHSELLTETVDQSKVTDRLQHLVVS